jgi:hypothetical protein
MDVLVTAMGNLRNLDQLEKWTLHYAFSLDCASLDRLTIDTSSQ